MFDIGQEDLPVCGRFDGHRGHHAGEPQSADQGHHLPVRLGRSLVHTAARRSASIETRHGRGDAAFIKKKQALEVDRSDYFEELPAPLEVRFRVSLLGVECLFLRRNPSRFNQRQIATWLTATPACWSSLSCNCASVRSGSLAIQANRCWRCSSPTAALRPGRCTRRSIDPVRVWAAEIFLAQPRLTRKSSASSSSVPSPFSYAVRNFRRKSSPYAFAILACRRRTAKHCLHYLLKRSSGVLVVDIEALELSDLS